MLSCLGVHDTRQKQNDRTLVVCLLSFKKDHSGTFSSIKDIPSNYTIFSGAKGILWLLHSLCTVYCNLDNWSPRQASKYVGTYFTRVPQQWVSLNSLFLGIIRFVWIIYFELVNEQKSFVHFGKNRYTWCRSNMQWHVRMPWISYFWVAEVALIRCPLTIHISGLGLLSVSIVATSNKTRRWH